MPKIYVYDVPTKFTTDMSRKWKRCSTVRQQTPNPEHPSPLPPLFAQLRFQPQHHSPVRHVVKKVALRLNIMSRVFDFYLKECARRYRLIILRGSVRHRGFFPRGALGGERRADHSAGGGGFFLRPHLRGMFPLELVGIRGKAGRGG